MRLFTSNRLEQLLELLAALVSRPLPPLQEEVILVQSQGMAHWLSMGLSQHLGVWANARFPFPLAFLGDVQKACGIYQDPKAWSPESLQWATAKALEQHQQHPAFEVLKHYLDHNQSTESRWQLAKRISNSFDEYMIYRPELLLAWDAGEEPDNWQAVLWRALVAEIAVPHRAQLQQQLLTALKAGNIDTQRLPSRLSIFGVSSLPPIYIEILTQLGQHIEINLLLMNPCEIYWGDILSSYELAHQRLKQGGEESGDLHLEESNALLASLGRVGRDFLELLYQYDSPAMSAFQANPSSSLLAQIQNDILYLQQNPEKQPIDGEDKSIQLHSCHSPMREVEVLYNQLLALFEQNPDLNSSDVLIMAPNIEDYAALIQSVFSPNDKTHLPFSIADKSLRGDGVLFDCFMQLLALPESRLTVSEVLSLLETPALRQQFGISETDLSQLSAWLQQAHIRWGIDADSRADLGLPAFAEYSWKQGLDRLLLGYALVDNSQEMHSFADIVPLDLVEGQESLLLGKLLRYTDLLFKYYHGLQTERRAADWLLYIEQLLSDFFYSDASNQADLQQLRYGLQQLVEQQQQAGFEQPISIKILATWFEEYLSRQLPALGFMTGKLTFCSLLPMRSIPFQVICLLGMNDKDFPRNFRAPSFDLVAAQPRKGDRSRRHDDRYLFLEALLSARQTFYISYIGQDIRDNSALQASTVVAVLQQYTEQHWGAELRAQIEQQHALQAFHPCYFQPDSDFFSYQNQSCAAGQALQNPDKQQPQFLSSALAPHASLAEGVIDLSQVRHFYKHPSRYFLQQCLSLQLQPKLERLADEEPLSLDGLASFQLKSELLNRALQGQATAQLQRWASIDGELPPAALADPFYQAHWGELQSFFSTIAEKQQKTPLAVLNKTLQLPDWRLSGTIDHIYPDGVLRYHPAKSKLKHIFTVWLQHLFLNAAAPKDYPRHSDLLFQNQSWRLHPVADAAAQLNQALNVFQQGHCQPLLYFPETSHVYWEQRFMNNKPVEDALKKAQQTWEQHSFQGAAPENSDSAHQRCFGGRNLEGDFAQAFVELNEQLLSPLAAVIEAQD